MPRLLHHISARYQRDPFWTQIPGCSFPAHDGKPPNHDVTT